MKIFSFKLCNDLTLILVSIVFMLPRCLEGSGQDRLSSLKWGKGKDVEIGEDIIINNIFF
jgi:hypothetical protein